MKTEKLAELPQLKTPVTAIPNSPEFRRDEVLAAIEFCVDLDSQDDRFPLDPAIKRRRIYDVRADRSTDLWTCLADSRNEVALGSDDPTRNGFLPFDSAWVLWKRNGGDNTYMLAFRGTVFGNKDSVIEDALVTTIPAAGGLSIRNNESLPITFARMPFAEVHQGFAYALFGAFFDGKYGALATILNTVPANSTLIITGHSQGAALATLAHAFFYYAAQDGLLGIDKKHFNLKSYVFAQPKPGNTQFVEDFAQITSAGPSSFTFNNSIDPVTMMPPSHIFMVDALEYVRSKSTWFRVMRSLNNGANSVRRFFSSYTDKTLANGIKKIQAAEHEPFYREAELTKDSGPGKPTGVSQGYVTAGTLVALTGWGHGSAYYGDPTDEFDSFVQHHSTSYRRLLEDLFGLPPTTKNSPELAPPPSDGIRAEKLRSAGIPVATH